MDGLPMLIACGLIVILAVILTISLYKADNAKNQPDKP